jgi:hypothetical protein
MSNRDLSIIEYHMSLISEGILNLKGQYFGQNILVISKYHGKIAWYGIVAMQDVNQFSRY